MVVKDLLPVLGKGQIIALYDRGGKVFYGCKEELHEQSFSEGNITKILPSYTNKDGYVIVIHFTKAGLVQAATDVTNGA